MRIGSRAGNDFLRKMRKMERGVKKRDERKRLKAVCGRYGLKKLRKNP